MQKESQLYIDVGNTLIKTRRRSKGVWSDIEKWDTNNLSGLASRLKQSDTLIICSVSGKNFDHLISIIDHDYILLNSRILANHISYDTPDTLGMDRVLAAIGAWSDTERASVIIDAGTATTIDFITGDGVFAGGVIMPGIRLMEKGLHQNTDLPEVKRTIPHQWPPKSTEEALQWGVAGSYIAAIESHIQRFQSDAYGGSVVVTGGDAPWLAGMLQSDVQIIPDAVFRGMSYVFDKAP